MASRRIRKKQEKRKLMETYKANRVQFKTLVDMANKYLIEEGINAEKVLGVKLPETITKNPTIEWLKSNPFATSSHAYFQEKIEEFQKDLRQERLKHTYFGDYDNMSKYEVIQMLIDMKLIKNRNWAYEDLLYDIARRFTQEEVDDIMDEYVRTVDRIRKLEKESDYREPGSFIVF